MSRDRFQHLAILIGGGVGAFLAGIFILNAAIGLLIGHGAEVEVPDLAGLAPREAAERLSGADLVLAVKSERASSLFEAGLIVSQFPKPLARVKPGRRIEVIISTGIETVAVPRVDGLGLREASLRLSDLELDVGEVIEVREASTPRGAVIATAPPPGAAAGRHGRVDLLISGGPPASDYVMPDLTGRLLVEVESAITRAGFALGTVSPPGGGPRGAVVTAQIPAAGARVHAGAAIDLVVSAR